MADLTDFLREGFQGDSSVLRSLVAIAQLTTEEAADFCQVSRETFRRWRRDRPAPTGAVRLLAIRAGFVPWPGWEKFFHCPTDGKLYHEDLRYGFDPGDVLQLHWMRDELGTVRAENARLRLALQEAERSAAPLVAATVAEPNSRSEAPRSQLAMADSPSRFSGQSSAKVIPFPGLGASADSVHLPSTSERVQRQQSARQVLGHLRRWLVRGNRQ